MNNPVVHFEIVGRDGKNLQAFYGKVFDWSIKADNPFGYGEVKTGSKGIDGGIAKSMQGTSYVTIYVEVDDLQKFLDRAIQNGGQIVIPPTEIPGAVTFAQFTDPEGHLIGLVKRRPG